MKKVLALFIIIPLLSGCATTKEWYANEPKYSPDVQAALDELEVWTETYRRTPQQKVDAQHREVMRELRRIGN